MPQPQSSLLDELERVSAELDVLMRDMRSGWPSQTRHDGYIDQVEQLAARMRFSARGPGRPINPLLGRVGSGLLW